MDGNRREVVRALAFGLAGPALAACVTGGVNDGHVPDRSKLAAAMADRTSGQQLVQVLREERMSGLEPIMPTLNKEVRAMGQTPAMRNVVLEKGAHWVDAFLLEAAHFPKGRHDDQVDSMTQALEWMRDRQIPSSNFFLYIEQETAARGARREINALVKLKAPAGRTHVQLNGGPTVMVRDGIVEVPESAVASLVREGYVKVTD